MKMLLMVLIAFGHLVVSHPQNGDVQCRTNPVNKDPAPNGPIQKIVNQISATFNSVIPIYIVSGSVKSIGPSSIIRKASQSFFLPNPANCSSYESADLALIKLEQGFEFNKYVSPIRLANFEVCPGTRLTVTGWGLTETCRYPELLRKGITTTADINSCREREDCANPSLVCTRLTQNGQASHFGDSGGPVVFYDEQGIAHQIGVVSHGHHASFSFYTKFVFAREWIIKITGLSEEDDVTL